MKKILLIIVCIIFSLILMMFIFLKAPWYISGSNHYDDTEMKFWETMSLKQVSYLIKYHTHPKLKIDGRGLDNQPREGGSAFSNGYFYSCDEGECFIYFFYYYDGKYLHMLNTGTTYGIIDHGYEEVVEVVVDEKDRLVLGDESEYYTDAIYGES